MDNESYENQLLVNNMEDFSQIFIKILDRINQSFDTGNNNIFSHTQLCKMKIPRKLNRIDVSYRIANTYY